MQTLNTLTIEELVEEFRRCIIEAPSQTRFLFEELQKRFSNTWPKEVLFNFYKNSANYHINGHLYELAQSYIDKAKQIAQEHKETEWYFQIQITEAVLLTTKGNHALALELFQKLLTQLPDNFTEKYKANILMRMGIAHGKSGNLQEALKHYLQALPYFDDTNDQMRFSIRANLLTTYMQLGMYDELESLYNDFKQNIHLCRYQSVLVFFYSNYAVYLNEQKKYAEALEQAETAVKLCKDIRQWSPLSIAMRVKSEALEHLGRSRLSYLYRLRNLQVLQNTTDYYSLSLAHLSLAYFLKKHSKKEKARWYAKMGYEIARTHQVKYILKMALEFLADWEQEDKNYVQAVTYLRELIHIKEELLNTEKTNAVADAMARYEVSEKEREAEKLRSEVAEYNLRLLRSQMNPHFIFNSINSINNFVLKNNAQTASYYLIRFSQLMRQILENSALTKVTLQKEIEFLKNYIELEQLRFSEPFHFSIIVDKRIDPSEIQLPPMLLQPYLENAIWHGLRHKTGKGEIIITFHEINQSLLITIADDGVGRKAAQQLRIVESHHQSKGMKITEERITKGLGGTVSVNDRLNNEMQVAGTIVEIKIPL